MWAEGIGGRVCGVGGSEWKVDVEDSTAAMTQEPAPAKVPLVGPKILGEAVGFVVLFQYATIDWQAVNAFCNLYSNTLHAQLHKMPSIVDSPTVVLDKV